MSEYINADNFFKKLFENNIVKSFDWKNGNPQTAHYYVYINCIYCHLNCVHKIDVIKDGNNHIISKTAAKIFLERHSQNINDYL